MVPGSVPVDHCICEDWHSCSRFYPGWMPFLVVNHHCQLSNFASTGNYERELIQCLHPSTDHKETHHYSKDYVLFLDQNIEHSSVSLGDQIVLRSLPTLSVDHNWAIRACLHLFPSVWNCPSGLLHHTWLWMVESNLTSPHIGLAAACHRAQNRQAWSTVVGMAASVGQTTRCN